MSLICLKDGRKWEVFAANYSFLQHNLTVPGQSRQSEVLQGSEIIIKTL